MIADDLLRRMRLYDSGDGRRVEVWMRHDGQFFVSSLRKRDGKAGWIEVRQHRTDSYVAAIATAEMWEREEQGKMP